jgi:hypothetical protein
MSSFVIFIVYLFNALQIFEGAKIIKNYQYIAMESIDSKFGNAKDVLKLNAGLWCLQALIIQ